MSDPQQPHGLQPSRLLHPWDFPGKSTAVGCHCLLWIYVYLWLIDVDVWLIDVDVWWKPARYFKAIILQLKINKFEKRKKKHYGNHKAVIYNIYTHKKKKEYKRITEDSHQIKIEDKKEERKKKSKKKVQNNYENGDKNIHI